MLISSINSFKINLAPAQQKTASTPQVKDLPCDSVSFKGKSASKRPSLGYNIIKDATILNKTIKNHVFNTNYVKNSRFSSVKIENSKWKESIFNKVTLDKVTFKDSSLEGIKFERLSYLYKTNFNNTRLKDVQFGDSTLNESAFNNAKLENVSFENSRLIRVDFINTDLKGADFSGSFLQSATFIDVKNADKANFDNCLMPRPIYEANKKMFSKYKMFSDYKLTVPKSSDDLMEKFKLSQSQGFFDPNTDEYRDESFYVVLKKK